MTENKQTNKKNAIMFPEYLAFPSFHLRIPLFPRTLRFIMEKEFTVLH